MKNKPTPEQPQTWYKISTLSFEFIAVEVVEASSSFLVLLDGSGQTTRTTRSTSYHFYVETLDRALVYCREELKKRIADYYDEIKTMKAMLVEHDAAFEKLASDGGAFGVQTSLFE